MVVQAMNRTILHADLNNFYASVEWTDGHVYDVDKIIDVRQAASLKCGGHGLRYTCRLGGKEIYLFCDEGKWFIEQ
jgi:hypothetical protein